MKKILLLSALGAAGLVSAKSAETKEVREVKSEKTFQLCGVLVTFYDSENNATGTQWFLIDAPTLSSCQAYQSFVKWNLSQAGFSISQQ